MKEEEKSNQEFVQWAKKNGCLIHPSLKVTDSFNGIQGVATTQNIPHKTLILAIPSQLILTVTKCYNDPNLHSLFQNNDDLFDYEAQEQAEFLILCVFLMYQRMNIQTSFWRPYLLSMQEPQLIIDWPDSDLYGLNQSVIEEVLHVRRQCRKVEQNLCKYLKKTKQFKHLQYAQITALFQKCYRFILTRCFGYCYSTACMIPVADLFNHGCEPIEHNIINKNLEVSEEQHKKYKKQKQNLNCSLLSLKQPETSLELPYRLKYLVQNNLITEDDEKLSQLRRENIDSMILQYNRNYFQSNTFSLEKMNFCEQNDDEDNDTDEQTYHQNIFTMEEIKKQQKQQMEEFQKHYVQVERLVDVEKRIDEEENMEKLDEKNTNEPSLDKQTSTTVTKQQEVQNVPISQQKQEGKNEREQKIKEKGAKGKNIPIEYVPSSDQDQSQQSDEDSYLLNADAYFSISTNTPVSSGSQLFNSYGSRTNKFLLIWYGFCYTNNLYDSVTLRMQALFSKQKPVAKSIVLDTYIGGHGLCFQKNEKEEVKSEEVSREFRLKRSHISVDLLMYVRLFLLNYYRKGDLYKIFVTVPSSLEFEEQTFQYLEDIVQSLYDRYPLQTIHNLNLIREHSKSESEKRRTELKLIYIEEQRKILDINMKAIQAALRIIGRLKKYQKFNDEAFKHENIQVVKILHQYLLALKQNFAYIKYEQKEK